MLSLVIGGGFDTTTALTAHCARVAGEHPDERDRLSRERDDLLDPATEEFLRFYTPAPGDGRTIADDCEIEGTHFKEGERLWLSWAMANRDPSVFANPQRDRPGPEGQPALQLRPRRAPLHRVQRRADRLQVHADRGARPDARLPV